MKRWVLMLVLALFSAMTIFVRSRANHCRTRRAGMVRVASFHRQTTRPLLSSASYSPAAIEIGGSTIRIEFAPGDLDLPVTKLIAWVSAAAGAVTDYYGRFPVGEARILIIPVENREGVLNGTSWGTRPAFTRIYVGELTNDDDLKNDWVMTHEMVHYAFPSVSAEHHWIEEGIATYVEPIARLEAGQIRAVKVWGDLVNGLPFGLPRSGDEGLDHTHTWGRTYWGGAMFCLLADVRIRRETDKSLWPARRASCNRLCRREHGDDMAAHGCARGGRSGSRGAGADAALQRDEGGPGRDGPGATVA